MISNYILAKTKRDEFEGEKIINKFRLGLALLYIAAAALFLILRKIKGYETVTAYSFIPNGLFLLFSIFIFFYLRNKKSVHNFFKYICVFIDMTIISVCIYVRCGHPELDPPISYLSIWALFYGVLILLGAFRYSVRCAILSGFYAGLCYLTVVILRAGALDIPYYLALNDKTISVSFPTFNEFFRVIALVVTGVITGMACKRHFRLFSGMIETQSSAAKTASKTMEQTHNTANTIRKFTDEIFHSSKEIFSTANNQAASVQEIVATVKENAQIAEDIADKTSNVASIASKTETDVVHGINVLKRNVDQLEEIKNKNDGVISGIVSLGNKINKICGIIETINTITEQTKVIAFNAALEAASAKKFGRRFSVVSSEVNRLADDISALTKEIRKQADDMQTSSSSLVVSGKESAKKIIEGNNLIKELEDIFNEIKTGAEDTSAQAQIITVSTEKQQKPTEQINTAIVDISKGLSGFINSTKAVSSSAEELTKMIHELDSLLTVKSEDGEDA
jgi:methyl-accepting chemotaxis protein